MLLFQINAVLLDFLLVLRILKNLINPKPLNFYFFCIYSYSFYFLSFFLFYSFANYIVRNNTFYCFTVLFSHFHYYWFCKVSPWEPHFMIPFQGKQTFSIKKHILRPLWFSPFHLLWMQECIQSEWPILNESMQFISNFDANRRTESSHRDMHK